MKTGVGLDIGTCNLVSARQDAENILIKNYRDCFIKLPKENLKMLKLSNIDFIESEDSVMVLGDEALNLANLFNQEVKRPLSKGIISSSEVDAFDVLHVMIKSLLGTPKIENEICCFSIPGAPIDDPDQSVDYHEAIFSRVVSSLGYTAIAGNEAEAIVFSECAFSKFSGIAISFGSGMTNCALLYRSLPILKFSVARGGDWIDRNAAKAVGKTASKMMSIKESGVDLLNPFKGDFKTVREKDAIVAYYKVLITYVLTKFTEEFSKVKDACGITEKIPLILSGGTSLAGNFKPFFEQTLKNFPDFPINISEIRHASDPLNSVAKGLLVQALSQ